MKVFVFLSQSHINLDVENIKAHITSRKLEFRGREKLNNTSNVQSYKIKTIFSKFYLHILQLMI